METGIGSVDVCLVTNADFSLSSSKSCARLWPVCRETSATDGDESTGLIDDADSIAASALPAGSI